MIDLELYAKIHKWYMKLLIGKDIGDLEINIDDRYIAMIILDSEGDIQVNLENFEEEPIDGGGCVDMSDTEGWEDGIEFIKESDMEMFMSDVHDKVIFIYELIFTE